jgi:nucleotidyltransferase substrate binding protein (TIGR01987 family)
MQKEVLKSFNELTSAFNRFKVNVNKVKEENEKELIIKRFEFITELFMKNLKTLLETKGYHCILPEDCIKAATKFGFLASETIFIEMLDDKNKILQMRNQNQLNVYKIPDGLYQRIKIRYTIAIGKSIERIKRDYIEKIA